MIHVQDKDLQKKIERIYALKQEHIFRFWDELNEEQQQNLLNDIATTDFDLMEDLIKQATGSENGDKKDVHLKPAPVVTLRERSRKDEEVRSTGREALKKGQVAAFLVAGGQGSRLGFDGPKGAFPITPVKEKTLFQLHAEKILASQRRYETTIPWYIMTSHANHEDTVSFFKEHHYFGLDPDNIMFFRQDMIPAVDKNGKFLLSAKDSLFKSPNGHGGSIKALWDSGAVADMKQRGIAYISYFQVDNVLVDICDPAYIGYHITHNADMSNKVVRKKEPGDKVGVICKINGNTGVVEYSDLSYEDMHARTDDGELKYWAGSIAIHIVSVAFIESENKHGFRLPYHIANKNIPYIDDQGQLVEPEGKNGIKFETFVFDALLDTDQVFTLEVERSREFSAVKNAEGSESPQTARQDLLRIYAEWLEAAGIKIMRDEKGLPKVKLEISPLFALDAEDLRKKRTKIPPITNGIYLA